MIPVDLESPLLFGGTLGQPYLASITFSGKLEKLVAVDRVIFREWLTRPLLVKMEKDYFL